MKDRPQTYHKGSSFLPQLSSDQAGQLKAEMLRFLLIVHKFHEYIILKATNLEILWYFYMGLSASRFYYSVYILARSRLTCLGPADTDG